MLKKKSMTYENGQRLEWILKYEETKSVQKWVSKLCFAVCLISEMQLTFPSFMLSKL